MESWKEEFVRLRIREMLKRGEMPCDEPEKVWAGRGSGSHCAACGELIGQTEIEYEVELSSGAAILRLHRRCHEIWLEECGPYRQAELAPR